MWNGVSPPSFSHLCVCGGVTVVHQLLGHDPPCWEAPASSPLKGGEMGKAAMRSPGSCCCPRKRDFFILTPYSPGDPHTLQGSPSHRMCFTCNCNPLPVLQSPNPGRQKYFPRPPSVGHYSKSQANGFFYLRAALVVNGAQYLNPVVQFVGSRPWNLMISN